MKEYLNQIQDKLIVGGKITQELVDQVSALITNSINQYDVADSKLRATTKQSISRKEKLNELYEKLDNLNNLQLRFETVSSQNQKLSKYKQVAVKEKQNINLKIKTFFDVKLSDTANKDYNKYKILATQFDFETSQQQIFDKNKSKYDLLQLAGTFGTQSITKMQTLPKSGGGKKTQTSG